MVEVVPLEEVPLLADLPGVAVGQPRDVAIDVDLEVVVVHLRLDLADRVHQLAVVLEDVPASPASSRAPADGSVGAKPRGIAAAADEIGAALADVLRICPLVVAGPSTLLD